MPLLQQNEVHCHLQHNKPLFVATFNANLNDNTSFAFLSRSFAEVCLRSIYRVQMVGEYAAQITAVVRFLLLEEFENTCRMLSEDRRRDE